VRFVFIWAAILASLLFGDVWNAPFDKRLRASDTLFSAYASPPKHLDPVVSYSSNEWAILSQICEPPLQYHYLKRPYTLVPLTLTRMPEVRYLDDTMHPTTDGAHAAFTLYRFELRDDVYYAPHPAFVKNEDGSLFYGHLTPEMTKNLRSPYDLPRVATRKLVADDYVYAIKRMALRQNHSPVLDVLKDYIVGLDAYAKRVTRLKEERGDGFDLRRYDIKGVQAEDTRHFTILIKGVYPQFLYWTAMNFFAPIPWEAERFYAQETLRARNITFDTFPVGTGAYYLARNIPYRMMELRKNPKFHTEYYPTLRSQEAKALSIPDDVLVDAGKKLPFIDRVVLVLEKERIPFWNKFLQGYYDASGVGSDTFDQAVSFGATGEMRLSDALRRKGIRMIGQTEPSIFYTAFNMADAVVGGYDEKKRKLRRAIAIANDTEEYISVFMNGRGKAAQGPIPPGIFGSAGGKEGCDEYVYRWKEGKCVRRSLDEAKRLLAEAGYPGGRDPDTGEPLKLYYDTVATGPDDRALVAWRRKQFAKLGIELVVRATDYNRFQEKVRNGKVQIFSWGWNADYPDAENFLFLLYGGNAAIDTNGSGINSANYKNPAFDALFKRIRTMPDGPERYALIRKAVHIARRDAPWIWGVNPESLTLVHGWYYNVVANAMASNTLKYRRIDSVKRVHMQEVWNAPVRAPLWGTALAALLLGWGAYRLYRRRQGARLRKEKVC
jgi:ABC-type transport system substrate-binding protein